METKKHSICVYAGSSDFSSPSYRDLAARTGAAIARAGLRLVFGGGKVGLMGAASRACRAAGGKTLGIIPTFITKIEAADVDGPLVEVDTMHQRKLMMFEESDAFLVLPGGIGTLEEAVEMISWKRLKLHDKPIVFLAEDGYWAPFFALMRHVIDARFASDALAGDFIEARSVPEAMEACRCLAAPAPSRADLG